MAGYQDMMSELLLSGTKTRTKAKLNELAASLAGVRASVSQSLRNVTKTWCNRSPTVRPSECA